MAQKRSMEGKLPVARLQMRGICLMNRMLLLASMLLPMLNADTLLGPTPYLSFGDSPFNGPSFSYFHLETFEDHLLNTPGVTGSPGGVTSVVFGPAIHDSVDFDDGVIDGSGL